MNSINEKTENLGGGIVAVTAESCRFGLDAILLSSFVKLKKDAKICDFGTGCGIIPLLLCKKERRIQVDAIEIRPEAAEMAQKSVLQSGLSDSITVICSDLKDSLPQKGAYDIVVCNPPYKKNGTGKTNSSESLKTARHEFRITLHDITLKASKILNNGGRLCVCIRPERLPELFSSMISNRIEPKRLRTVQQRPDTPPWLVLCEGMKSAKPGLIIEPAFFVETKPGENSPEMNEIFR